jgi:hypothetical protein
VQLIFASEYTKAMDADWHSGHFCCWSCDFSLAGHRYVLRDEHPYCIKCYENMFANKCEECKAPIGTDSKVSNTCFVSEVNIPIFSKRCMVRRLRRCPTVLVDLIVSFISNVELVFKYNTSFSI